MGWTQVMVRRAAAQKITTSQQLTSGFFSAGCMPWTSTGDSNSKICRVTSNGAAAAGAE
jgi:hypothetical protein